MGFTFLRFGEPSFGSISSLGSSVVFRPMRYGPASSSGGGVSFVHVTGRTSMARPPTRDAMAGVEPAFHCQGSGRGRRAIPGSRSRKVERAAGRPGSWVSVVEPSRAIRECSAAQCPTSIRDMRIRQTWPQNFDAVSAGQRWRTRPWRWLGPSPVRNRLYFTRAGRDLISGALTAFWRLDAVRWLQRPFWPPAAEFWRGNRRSGPVGWPKLTAQWHEIASLRQWRRYNSDDQKLISN